MGDVPGERVQSSRDGSVQLPGSARSIKGGIGVGITNGIGIGSVLGILYGKIGETSGREREGRSVWIVGMVGMVTMAREERGRERQEEAERKSERERENRFRWESDGKGRWESEV